MYITCKIIKLKTIALAFKENFNNIHITYVLNNISTKNSLF